MKRLALAAIRIYQRYLSPKKGYCCAYRAHTGHASCSTLGYRAIERFGVFRGVGILRQRMYKCGVAYRRFHTSPRILHSQSGYCDLPCDAPCDLPHAHCDLPCDGCDLGEAACDLMGSAGNNKRSNSGKKNSQSEADVHIPKRNPNSGNQEPAAKDQAENHDGNLEGGKEA